jgi:hypothetical protein
MSTNITNASHDGLSVDAADRSVAEAEAKLSKNMPTTCGFPVGAASEEGHKFATNDAPRVGLKNNASDRSAA